MIVYRVEDKIYNKFNFMVFSNIQAIKDTIKSDLSEKSIFNNYYVDDWEDFSYNAIGGIDSLDKYISYLINNNSDDFKIIKIKVID